MPEEKNRAELLEDLLVDLQIDAVKELIEVIRNPEERSAGHFSAAARILQQNEIDLPKLKVLLGKLEDTVTENLPFEDDGDENNTLSFPVAK